MTWNIAVIGAGVIGLSTAVHIQEGMPGSNVIVIADKFSPNTTGDGSGGFWEPYTLQDTPVHKIRKWGEDTFRHMTGLADSAHASETGAFLVSGYILGQDYSQPPHWADIVFGFRDMNKDELQRFPGYKFGQTYTSCVVECRKYLPWLMQRFIQNGGKTKMERVQNLNKLGMTYDVVVNCVGVDARHVVNDELVEPVKGQLVRVRAPWIKQFAMDDTYYILPGTDTVALGGTSERGNWDVTVDEETTEKIIQGCSKIMPSLKKAEVLDVWTGLRPSRTSVRLEVEKMKMAEDRYIQVVHNYGHGGAGVTLHWGCAKEAAGLVQGCLQEKANAPHSRL